MKRIHVPEHYHNPHVFDDPRAEDPTLLPKIYHPYPDYESSEWKQTHRGNFQPCMGPRGMYLNESLEDRVGVYVGIPEGTFLHRSSHGKRVRDADGLMMR